MTRTFDSHRRERRPVGPARLRVLLVAAVAAAGCTPEPAVDRGRELFSSPAFSSSPANAFSCATCHPTDATAAVPTVGIRRPAGYTLHDAVARPSWWGGAYTHLLDAVNECYVEFMRGAALSPDDVQGRALLVYLESLAPDAKADALPLTVVQDVRDVPAGDAVRGASSWAATCAVCHGSIHDGAARLAGVPVLPEEPIAEHGRDPQTGARPMTIEKVRHGRFFGIGGNMPLYSVEALTDAEIGDLLAYLSL